MMAAEKQIIFVLGSHRSGTSAVTHLLHSMGLNLGKELLPAQIGINDKGFWENKKAVEINEKILKRLGSSWFDFRPLPDGWDRQELLQDICLEIKDFLKTEFDRAPFAAIKDPRMCRLFPLWKKIAEQEGWCCNTINIYRNIFSSSASLVKRDAFSPSVAKMIWLVDNLWMELNSRNLKSAYIDYDYLITQPENMAKNIANFFKEIPFEKTHKKEGVILDQNLNHHPVPQDKDSSSMDEFDLLGMEIADNFKGGVSDDARKRMDNIRRAYCQLLGTKSIAHIAYEQVVAYVNINQRLSSVGEMYKSAQQVIVGKDKIAISQREEITAAQASLAALVGRVELLEKENLALKERSRNNPPGSSAAGNAGSGKSEKNLCNDIRIDDLKTTLAKRSDELRDSLSKIKDITVRLEQEKERLGIAEAEISAKNKTLYEFESENFQLSEGIALRDEEILNLNSKLKDMTKELDNVIAFYNENLARISRNNDVIAAYDRKVQGLQGELEAFKQLTFGLNKKIEALQANEAYFNEEFLQLRSALDRLSEAIGRLSDENKAHVENIKKQDEYISKLDAEIKSKDKIVDGLNSKYFYIRTRFIVRFLVKIGLIKVPHE